MENNFRERRTIDKRIVNLEINMGKLQTEIPHITKAVDRIEKKISAGQVMLIGILVSFIVSVVLLFATFVLSKLGG